MKDPAKQPVIGITTSFRDNEQRLNAGYANSVERAGGVPVIVPVFNIQPSVSLFLDVVDGLVITGGPAVVDGLIGILPDDIEETDLRRVRNDKWILQEALNRHIPVLGICYGMQLINSLQGGTIYADVQSQLELKEGHSPKRGANCHPLIVSENSHLNAIIGDHSVVVNTHHIQAVATVGSHLNISATSPDGVIGAIETDDGRILGVQFHPELEEGGVPRLFEHLVHQAGRTRRKSVE